MQIVIKQHFSRFAESMVGEGNGLRVNLEGKLKQVSRQSQGAASCSEPHQTGNDVPTVLSPSLPSAKMWTRVWKQWRIHLPTPHTQNTGKRHHKEKVKRPHTNSFS
jgi:hypothetical protein